jgi:hypothetical protein
MQHCVPEIAADLPLVLTPKARNVYRRGNNVVELDGDYRRDVIIGIGIIGIACAVGCPGKKKHESEGRTPYELLS